MCLLLDLGVSFGFRFCCLDLAVVVNVDFGLVYGVVLIWWELRGGLVWGAFGLGWVGLGCVFWVFVVICGCHLGIWWLLFCGCVLAFNFGGLIVVLFGNLGFELC